MRSSETPSPTGLASPALPKERRRIRMSIRVFAERSRRGVNHVAYSADWRTSITAEMYHIGYLWHDFGFADLGRPPLFTPPPPNQSSAALSTIMAHRAHPTSLDADNSSGSLPAACSDWRNDVADSMSARATTEPTTDAGNTTAGASPKAHLSISLLPLKGGPYTTCLTSVYLGERAPDFTDEGASEQSPRRQESARRRRPERPAKCQLQA